MVVHVVRHFAAIGHTDVRGDEEAADAARDQVSVEHAGTSDVPGLFALEPCHRELLHPVRQLDRRIRLDELDIDAIRGEQALRSIAGLRPGWHRRRSVTGGCRPKTPCSRRNVKPCPETTAIVGESAGITVSTIKVEPRQGLDRGREVCARHDDLGGADAGQHTLHSIGPHHGSIGMVGCTG